MGYMHAHISVCVWAGGANDFDGVFENVTPDYQNNAWYTQNTEFEILM